MSAPDPPHPHGPTPADGTGIAVTSRILPLAFMGAPLIFVLAMWFVLGGTEDAMAPGTGLLVPLAVAGGSYLMIEAIGYRAQPLPRGLTPHDATRKALAAWVIGMFLRIAFAEVVLFFSLAAAFLVTTGGFLIVVVGCLLTVALVALHGFPRRGAVDRVATALEADGTPSGLRQAFGYA